MTKEIHEQNLAKDSTFKGIVVASTVLAVCATFGFLAAIVIDPAGGLSFRWQWRIFIWVAAAFASVLYVWKSVWAVTLDPQPRNKARLRRGLILFLLLSVCSFIYPLRFVLGKFGGAYFIGFAAAVIVLAIVGAVIRWFIRTVEEQDRIALSREAEQLKEDRKE